MNLQVPDRTRFPGGGMMKKDLKYRLIDRKFREFFLPTLSMALANNMALFIDSVLVSRLLGISHMPAIQLCSPIVTFVNMVYWMLGLGGSLLASNAMADHDRDEANRLFSVSMTVLMIFGVLVAAFGTFLRGPLVSFLCHDEALRADVSEYCSVLVLGMPLLCYIMSLSYFARSDGSPKLSFQAVLISNLINLTMDIVLMKFFGMGLKGAALATVIGYVGGSAWISRYLMSGDRQLRIVSAFSAGIGQFFSYTWKVCVKGFPTASTQLYITICTQVMNTLITAIGGAPGLQAFSVYKNSLFLGYILFIGTAQTLSPIVSVYYHEGDFDRVRYVLLRSIRIVFIGGVLLAFLFALCPAILLKMYSIDGADKEVYMASAIRLFVISYPFIGLNFLISFYWQAIKQQTLSALMTVLEGLVLPLALVWLFSRFLDMNGVWIGCIAAEVTATVFAFAVMWVLQQKNKPDMGAFLLPTGTDADRYSFTVEMQNTELVRLSQEAGEWVNERLSERQGTMTCLALEEMLTGIALANDGAEDVIDVSLRETGSEIIVSIRDMGKGFNPTVRDPELDYEFDNAAVLNKVASKIEFDRSLGMNATRIHLSV